MKFNIDCMMGGGTVPDTENKCSFCDIPGSGDTRLFGNAPSFICEYCLVAFHRTLVNEMPRRACAQKEGAMMADCSNAATAAGEGQQTALESTNSSAAPAIGKSSDSETSSAAAAADTRQEKAEEAPEEGAEPEIPDISKIIIDNTSGLYNLRHFHRQLEEMFSEHKSDGRPISLLLINIDHFRQINDAKGFAEGDKVLKESGELFRELVRDSGTVYRYGGDEFAIILRETDKRNATEIAKQIREAFQFRFHGHVVKLTVSVGVSTYPDDGESGSDMIYAADKALYSSQRNGQNRVTVASSLRLF